MAKKPRIRKTKSRSLNLPKNEIIEEWMNNQENLGMSLNDVILLKIEEYGIEDYPISMVKRLATTKTVDKTETNDDNSNILSSKEKQHRTATFYDEGPVLEWINAQSNLSNSIASLITDIASQYGRDDFLLTIAKLNGQRNKFLNQQSITKSNYPNDEGMIDSPKVENNTDTSNANEVKEQAVHLEDANEANDKKDQNDFDLSILHNKDFLN